MYVSLSVVVNHGSQPRLQMPRKSHLFHGESTKSQTAPPASAIILNPVDGEEWPEASSVPNSHGDYASTGSSTSGGATLGSIGWKFSGYSAGYSAQSVSSVLHLRSYLTLLTGRSGQRRVQCLIPMAIMGHRRVDSPAVDNVRFAFCRCESRVPTTTSNATEITPF
jgi:hypothetical protein